MGLFVAGLAANACVNARTVAVTSEKTGFEANTYLRDGKGWTSWRANAAASGIQIQFDMNLLVDDDFDTDTKGAAPDSTDEWVVLSGAVTVEDDPVTPAEGALRFGAANSEAYVDFELSQGKTYRFSMDLYAGSTDDMVAYIIDLDRHRYWTGSAWATSKTAFATKSGTGYATSADDVTFEQPNEFAAGPTRCRLLFEKEGTTDVGYVDLVFVIPKIDFAAVVGLIDVPDSVDILAQSKAGALASYTTRGTLNTSRYRRFAELTAPSNPERYWQFLINGECFFPPWLAVPLLGEAVYFTRNPRYGMATVREMPQEGPEGFPTNQSRAQRFSFQMEWAAETETSLRSIADQLVGASRHGAEPVLVVPDETRSDFVYGRGGGLRSFSYERVTNPLFTYGLSFNDDPLGGISQ